MGLALVTDPDAHLKDQIAPGVLSGLPWRISLRQNIVLNTYS